MPALGRPVVVHSEGSFAANLRRPTTTWPAKRVVLKVVELVPSTVLRVMLGTTDPLRGVAPSRVRETAPSLSWSSSGSPDRSEGPASHRPALVRAADHRWRIL